MKKHLYIRTNYEIVNCLEKYYMKETSATIKKKILPININTIQSV